ncbi:MAG: radical SAM protein [Nitrospirae bacterium]|nr:radical SAM protein [Nitrospirota bacterium]MBF0618087.1 radical SAM protein [Nitrospirota bacterium]
MTDKYRIDSHKLIYHVDRVNSWLNGDDVYPIYLEISPSGTCNHRCTFCGLDFMGYKRQFINASVLMERVTEMASLGIKSINYAGEGEPFLHRDMPQIITHTKTAGIDVAMTTNGVFFTPDIAAVALKHAEWIKVSIAAGTKETYAKIHRTKESDFDTVIANMKEAAIIKKRNNYKCTLGMQMLCLPENHSEAVTLTQVASEIGMNYLVIKPYSHHPHSTHEKYKDIRYADYLHLANELKGYNTENFSVIVRINTMKKWDEGVKRYNHCNALPFWAYIDSAGGLWSCLEHLKDDRFYYGNVIDNTFKEVWESQRRKDVLKMIRDELDINECRLNCRMDSVNAYLWELQHPPEHVNFI